jgi:hypothetical protein
VESVLLTVRIENEVPLPCNFTGPGLKENPRAEGDEVAFRLTLPAKPFWLVMSTVELTDVPTTAKEFAGAVKMLNPLMLTATVTDLTTEPVVPVTATM